MSVTLSKEIRVTIELNEEQANALASLFGYVSATNTGGLSDVMRSLEVALYDEGIEPTHHIDVDAENTIHIKEVA